MEVDLVSIISPSFNSGLFISQTIDSVISQTFENWELLIIDDGSTDRSVDIVKNYMKENKRIKLFILDRNYGPSYARNFGVIKARGRYISFLDTDDIWYAHKLERQINFMKNNNLFFTFSSYDIIDEANNNVGMYHTKCHVNYESLLKSCVIGTLTAIYDTSNVGKMFMPPISKGEDFVLWLRILTKLGSTKGITESLASYRVRAGSLSSNKIIAAFYQWKIYRNIESLGFLKSCYYFTFYIYNGLFKYKR